MGKDKSEKKDKKEKKPKLTEVNGVSKKSKKDKKEKKEKRKSDVTELLEAELESSASPAPVQAVKAVDEDGDASMSDAEAPVAVVGAVVPFANPLADEKQTKKVMKGVKKAAKHKTLKRGVKEVVKALRKSQTEAITSANSKDPAGVVIIAADISPMDVISHLPVLCEDHNIPYMYVTSRAELGAAGATKRPTSVVMISKDRAPSKKGEKVDAEAQKEYVEAYGSLVKLVLKASEGVTK